jgi:hypothetical protein
LTHGRSRPAAELRPSGCSEGLIVAPKAIYYRRADDALVDARDDSMVGG